jgi:hypothetical protein
MLLQPRWGCVIHYVPFSVSWVFVVDVPAVLMLECAQDVIQWSGVVSRDFQPGLCFLNFRLREIACTSFRPLIGMSGVLVRGLPKNEKTQG